MYMRPVSLPTLRQLDRLWFDAFVCDAPCTIDTLRKADFSGLLPFSSLHTRIQHAQADKSPHVDPTRPLVSAVLEEPEEPGPEDECQVDFAAKCTDIAHRRQLYQCCDAWTEWLLSVRMGHVQRESA